MDKIKLFIVDDHTIVRDGIRAMMFIDADIEVIGDFGDSIELFTALSLQCPDVILLDISLPGLSGIDITKLISEKYPKISILILSALTDETSIIESIKAGAKGFLPKEVNKDELRKAIKEAYQGKMYFCSVITQTILDGYIQSIVSGVDKEEAALLTEREIEIVKLFCDGLLYKEIADKLNLSVKTIEAHKSKIMHKLELKSTVDLVKYAIQKKIVFL